MNKTIFRLFDGSKVNYEIFPYRSKRKTKYIVLVREKKNGFSGYLTRNVDAQPRVFSTRSGARKAIWREKNGEYHR